MGKICKNMKIKWYFKIKELRLNVIIAVLKYTLHCI